MNENITQAEKDTFVEFWSKQKMAIAGKVSENTMKWFNIYTAPKNIGYEFGELRPGKLGQWDLYHWLTDPKVNACGKKEAIFASGLTAQEVAEQERRDELEYCGVDPDCPLEVMHHEMIQNMPPDKIDEYIAGLEKMLELPPV